MNNIDSFFKNMADDAQACRIRVDKDGSLWYQNAEMTHPGINQLLLEHVELDADGRYVICLNGETCLVEPDDTAFVILGAREAEEGCGGYCLTLNDHTTEWLNPESLWQNPDHVLYARVKGGRFPARFARPAYYQLADFLIEREGDFFLPANGREYKIQQMQPGGR